MSLDEPTKFFAALADPTRLRLIRVLAQQSAGLPLCVNALAGYLGISQPAVSQHLRVLRAVGLVRAARCRSRVHYSLDYERLRQWQQLVHECFAFVEEDTQEGERIAECPVDVVQRLAACGGATPRGTE
jgi:ArsR family transcriptional regulator